MKQIAFAATIAFAIGWVSQASAAWPWGNANPPSTPWNGPYYSAAWGMPVAVVVPPTARAAGSLGSGIGGSGQQSLIPSQFRQDYPAGSTQPTNFLPAPVWPSDTQQMGYYYVRGPRR